MHDVKFSIPEREIGKADIEFKIKKGGKLLGTLRVSKGSIVWLPKGPQNFGCNCNGRHNNKQQLNKMSIFEPY